MNLFKLPENKPQVPKDTPRNYFIYGETMSGKSYLANEFPNPIVLNTDGNATANSVPSIQLVNIKNKEGRITNSVIKQLGEIILALQTQKHSYETVVVDVIDDAIEMIKIAVCAAIFRVVGIVARREAVVLNKMKWTCRPLVEPF